MPRSPALSVILLIVGIALLIWGFSASESFASEVSETFQGAPSNKAMVLMVIGGIIAAAGLLTFFRRGK